MAIFAGRMKSVVRYIKEFWKEDFQWAKYAYTFCFIGLCITLNYIFNFHNKVVESPHGGTLGLTFFILFYSFAYYAVAIPCLYWSKSKALLSKPAFWLKSLSFLFVAGIAGGFYYHNNWLNMINDLPERRYLIRIAGYLKWAAIYIPLLFILKMIFDRKSKGLYGFNTMKMNLRVYLILLLIISPLIISASFTPDFLNAYPRFRPWQVESVFNLPKWIMTSFFELSYGINFVMVELMFRGALIIGMATLMGKNSILPMVATYAFIHFGKPIGESISSVFGGYILGIIAWRTCSIWGGAILHLGVAWLMELMGFIQFYIIGMKR
jgi:hypothetical protein